MVYQSSLSEGMKEEGGQNKVSALDEHIVYLFNAILAIGKYPSAWQIAILIALAKGSIIDTKEPK